MAWEIGMINVNDGIDCDESGWNTKWFEFVKPARPPKLV